MQRACRVLMVAALVGGLFFASLMAAQQPRRRPPGSPARQLNLRDARNIPTGQPAPALDPEYAQYGIYARTAPRGVAAEPIATSLPLTLNKGDRIALIGNTLFDRAQHFGYIEALLHQRYPQHQLIVRNLSWSADTIDLQPRPENFADLEQHLTHEQIDIIFAAYGFNESFAGAEGLEAFRQKLTEFLVGLKTRSFNGRTAPRIVLLSPIANENVLNVPAADMNNAQIKLYADVMRAVAAEQHLGFVDLFSPTQQAMDSLGSDLTINGIHLNDDGYRLLAALLFERLFDEQPPEVNERLRQAVLDKNRQFLRRYRPLNTFYYTGGRSKDYGYLDFLPAMKNFDIMVANRDRRIWDIAQGKPVPDRVDDANVPELPETIQSRGANEWMTAADELRSFQVDPRFEVTLFAGEEEFPDIAAPIQIRWDAQGRMWVSCSTTYPHVYPGFEPADKLVILEDTDRDGKADRSSVFADDLHIPLSFEFGDGGVYVSEMPDLTFLKDTDGDGKADFRERLLTGFGTEDSHHALHDFIWTPDGDLLFRESIFHHSQVETPYGPVRMQNSGWFRFQPKTHHLTSFGSYRSTNPWGVAFDDWGQHVASHPIYAQAFHALNPPYPEQHPVPRGLQAYSGTCGHEFVDFATFPDDMQGGFVKVRYKPTNRVEFHRWREMEFGYEEEYVGDIIFSTNLSFIPVDVRFGPDGALYICDWYNPVKGHMQYSLRDERRDRHSGRIWRVVAKDRPLQEPPRIAGASVTELLDVLQRPESRYRYWARRELRERDPDEVQRALAEWLKRLDPADPRYRHHQLEAVWAYRGIDVVQADLLRELLRCENHHARAAAVHQLRYWHGALRDAVPLLRAAANDPSAIVRMEAAIAASYIGTQEALEALLDLFSHSLGGHLEYAVTCALGSESLRRHWEGNPAYDVPRRLRQVARSQELKEPTPTAKEAQFDRQPDLKVVPIGCMPERMRYTIEQFAVTPGQPVKIVFTNTDATDHNLLIVKPGALEEVGMAANEMAKDPRNANSDFIPEQKRPLIVQAAPMIGPTRKSQIHVLRFIAPQEPGIYPFVCTFPGHWVVMKGNMVVARELSEVESMLAAARPQVVREWKLSDFAELQLDRSELAVMRGMQAFAKAQCHQCHAVAGHGVNLGPDLTEVAKRFQGTRLLEQILQPSLEINEKFRSWVIATRSGELVSGVIQKEDERAVYVMPNLLNPAAVTAILHEDIEARRASPVSSMPEGMVNVLTREEILNLLAFLEAGGYQSPGHLNHKH